MPEKLARPRLSAPERRASIIGAAITLFSERGFRGTTTRELAAAVGVTEPVLYEHFKTKRDLYTAIIDTKMDSALSGLRELANQALTAADDEAFFLSLAREIFNFYIGDPAFVRLLLFSTLEGHELKDILHEQKAAVFFDIVGGYLERRIAQGRLRRLDTQVVVGAFAGMVSNYATDRALYTCPPPPAGDDAALRDMVGIFLHGICPNGKDPA